MVVKAKFKCSFVTNFGTQKQIQLNAICGYEGENADYSKYTPSGKVEMTIDHSTPAFDFFNPGDEIYLTFIKID